MLKITGDVCESYEIRILCSINPDIASNLNTDPDPGPEPAFFFTLPEIYLDPDPYCDYGTYHVSHVWLSCRNHGQIWDSW